jgi:hypothetical protein
MRCAVEPTGQVKLRIVNAEDRVIFKGGLDVRRPQRNVRLLRVKSTLHDRQVLDLNRILERGQINPLPTRHYDRAEKPYSLDEITTLLVAIRTRRHEVPRDLSGTPP